MLQGQNCLSILETLSDGILIIDHKNIVHFANSSMDEIFTATGTFSKHFRGQLPVEQLLEELQSPQDFRSWIDRAFRTREDVIGDILFKDGRIYECKSSYLPIGDNEVRLWNFRNITHPRQIEKSIRAIIKGTSLATGLEFFRSLVKHLAEILGYRYALVGELVADNKVRTLAVWAGDKIVDNLTYDLGGTPCANVADKGLCLYDSGIQEAFPGDRLLTEMEAQSYFGIPLKDQEDQTLGILVLLDDKPLVNIPLAQDLLQVFASRAAAELSRMKTEQDLHHREAFEALLSSVSTHFMELPVEETDAGVLYTLQSLGEFSEADRAYLFKLSEDKKTISNTHEWCEENVSCEVHNLQNLPCEEIPWAMAPILRKEILYVPSVAAIPVDGQVEKEHWKEQDIQSLVCVPVLIGGDVYGFLGLDSVKHVRHWDESDLKLLKTFAEVIANAIDRQKQANILYDTLKAAEADRNNITAILDSVADPLIVRDKDGQILLMNRAAEKLLNDKLSDTPENLQVTSQLHKDLISAFRRARPGKPFDIVLPTVAADNPITLQARVAETRDSTGARSGHVISLRDVTREREIDRMKSEFISTAAHELNTPLSAILGYAELLLDKDVFGEFSDHQKEDFLREIVSRGEALSIIVDDLLDISRIESGRPIALNIEECDLSEVLQKAVNFYRKHDNKHEYQLTLPEKQGELTVQIDYHRINQVMENLLSNASKYSPAGKKITVCGKMSHDRWEIEVKDEGIGMSRNQVERIFDKFFRADTSDTAVGGLGLGMSIAQQIVIAHGGNISVRSRERKGTTVTLTLPRASERPDSPHDTRH